MCGLARCGKSTWLNKNKKDAVVICPDEIRAKIFGHQFHQESEGFVWAFAESMVRLLLEQNKGVIIDATNLTYGSRDKWIRIAKEYGIKVEIIWIKTSLKKCKERNKKSKKGNKIPVVVLDRMASMFESPFYNEYKEKIKLIEVSKSKTTLHILKRELGILPSNYYWEEIKKGKQ